MKLKEYLNSLVLKRKSNVSSKSTKQKLPHKTISSTDCHYEICEYEEPNKFSIDNRHSQTQILLTRHAHLINTIIGKKHLQENICPHCQILPHQLNQENLLSNPHYSSTLATCNPKREYQYQTYLSTSNNSLWTKTRQRSKIRTNPWIKTSRILQPEYSVYDPTLSSRIIHSESFPQTVTNGNNHSLKPSSNIIFHQNGCENNSSLNNHSSLPDNTNNDDHLLDKNQHISSYTKHLEQCFPQTTISSDNKQNTKKSIHPTHYQRSTNKQISNPKKSFINHNYHSRSSSPRLNNDHFSIKFEEILENQQNSLRNNPFILPLDKTNIKLSSPSSIQYSSKLKKTNSHTILKHLEEIENEIELIKNLNFNHNDDIFPSNIYSKQNEKQSINEQVNQWVEECLTTNKNNNIINYLQNNSNHLLNTIKNDNSYISLNNKNYKTSSLSKLQNKSELMTAFYLTSIPTTTERTLSFINQPLQLSKSPTITKDFKTIHECPF